jgi:hypothetical protein
MTLQRKLLATAVGSFLAGALIVGVAGNVIFSSYVKNQFISSYYGHAVQAQFAVRTLSRLRVGDITKPVHDLEVLLDGHTMQLAEYETVVAPTERDPFVYRTVAEIRAYRVQFPAQFEYPLQQAEYQKALDLGKKGGE